MKAFEDFLAQTIRRVDGNHKHGACTLAELLIAEMDRAGWVVCRWDEKLLEYTMHQVWDDRIEAE